MIKAVGLLLRLVLVNQENSTSGAGGQGAACRLTENPSAFTARWTRSRVSGLTFATLFTTRETVTRATPAALATSSMVEFRFIVRVRWQGSNCRATAIARSDNPDHLESDPA